MPPSAFQGVLAALAVKAFNDVRVKKVQCTLDKDGEVIGVEVVRFPGGIIPPPDPEPLPPETVG